MRKFFSSLAQFFMRTWLMTGVAFKRLLTQRMLSLAAIVGLMIASGLILSIPLYADATYFRLFREELLTGRDAELANNPPDYAPLAFVFEANIAGRDMPQWEDGVPVDEYLTREAPQEVGLPIDLVVRRFHIDGMQMYPPRDPNNPGTQYYLTYASLGFVTPIEETTILVDGALPQPTFIQNGEMVQALASEAMAAEFGVQTGDIYTLRSEGRVVPVLITGLWRPVDPLAPYWDHTSASWLLVDEQTYTQSISAVVTDDLRFSMWTFYADGSGLHSGDIAALDRHVKQIQARALDLLPQAALTISPLDALARYQQNAPALTYLLFAFSVPIMGLIVAFIGLVAGLFVGQQRGEMAILRSRGASVTQVAWMSLLQGALLGVVALAGGAGLGYWVAHGIGRARSFLDFTAPGALRVSITPVILGYGLLGIAVLLMVQVLFPTLSAAANTVVTYKQERARSMIAPWWQRFFFDFLLLIPAGYGMWMLNQQSKLVTTGAESVPDPLQNPLLMLVPAMGIFAAALFTLRLVPRIMDLASWILQPTDSVGMLMSARYLGRSPAFYSAPLVLLVLTLGLSAFTASLAKTLDSQLTKQMYYRVGADLNLYELGTTVTENTRDAVYTFRPVEEHLSLPGVMAATRVGRYDGTILLPSGATDSTFLGVDRLNFPAVAYWQRDFAKDSLGVMLNQLGAEPGGVLVPQQLLDDEKLSVGDTLTIGVKTGVIGESVTLKPKIVGAFDLFPTWYPENGPMVIGNLDEFFLQAGAEYPHEVWLKTAPGADPEGLVYAVRGYSILLDQQADQSKLVENGLNTLVKGWSSAGLLISNEQRRPERQGLFGLLSVGFVASALLTMLGFLLYALFSFRRRFIEMGMLRAIGLSVRQMIALLAAELAFLVLLGIGAGTLLGIVSGNLFVPYLQIGAATQALYPPFQIEIAWASIFQIYALFAALFFSALAVLVALLRRMKVFQAIKLGETN